MAFNNELDFIMAYEDGELELVDVVEGFQGMIDSGVVWSLQGSYGRTAARLIEQGYCFVPGAQPKGPYQRALVEQHNPGQNERDEAEAVAYTAQFPASVHDEESLETLEAASSILDAVRRGDCQSCKRQSCNCKHIPESVESDDRDAHFNREERR